MVVKEWIWKQYTISNMYMWTWNSVMLVSEIIGFMMMILGEPVDGSLDITIIGLVIVVVCLLGCIPPSIKAHKFKTIGIRRLAQLDIKMKEGAFSKEEGEEYSELKIELSKFRYGWRSVVRY